MPAEEEASEAFRARKSVEGGDPGGKILVLKRHLSWKVSQICRCFFDEYLSSV